MSHFIHVSKYLVASTALHLAVGFGGYTTASQWAGLKTTTRALNPIKIASLEVIRPQHIPKIQNVPRQISQKRSSLKTRENSTPDTSMVHHGVHVSNEGRSEQYTSQLHAALQRHFYQLFKDMPISSEMRFALDLKIDQSGQVLSASVQPSGRVQVECLQRMQLATAQLEHLPAPIDGRSWSVSLPVSFRP
jgi:hypothetical protein